MTQFAVLMPVYIKDHPTLFERALASIYDNTIQPAEVLVVVDGPITNELNFVLNKFEHKKTLKVLRLEINSGITNALNIGLNHISSDWVFRADADDYNLPDRFEKQIEYLKLGYGLVGGLIQEVDFSGSPLGIRTLPISHQEIIKFAAMRNPFNHMTIAFSKKNVIDLGGYPDLYLREDYALWAKMLSKGVRACNIKDVLVFATAGDQMIIRRGGIKYALAELKLQKHLVKCKLKNPYKATVDGIIRASVFLSPFFIRKFLYVNFLRSRLTGVNK